jgi:hypothetical protein
MIPVAFTRSGFEAKVLAAQLGSEGVVWELRGDVDGVYPVGGIEVLVPFDEAERARDVLATASIDPPEVGIEEVPPHHHPILVGGAMVLVVAFVVVRLLAVG